MKAFKVLLLLLCLFQIAFFKDGADDNGYDDHGGDDHGGNNNKNQCKIEYDPGYHEVRLKKGMSTLARSNFMFSDLEFEGYCDCYLYLFSMKKYMGKMLNYPFSKSNSHHIIASKIWNRKPKSFKVICKF